MKKCGLKDFGLYDLKGKAVMTVATLLVRDVDASLVLALKQGAAKHGRSAEAEHREILAGALRRPRKRHLADVLAAIPNVGRDENFARVQDVAEAQRLPD